MTARSLTGLPAFMTVLLSVSLLAPHVSSDWRGRFDLGGTPVFYDDASLEDRTPLTGGLRLLYSPGDDGAWMFRSNLRLRTEANSPDGNMLRIRDMFIRYGRDADTSPWLITAGVFSPESISGCGDVMGGDVRVNIAAAESFHLGFGAFAGANSVTEDGATAADGIRLGGYISGYGPEWGRFSLAYTAVSNTDLERDEMEVVTIGTMLRLGGRFDFHQSGEYVVASETGEAGRVTAYTADAGCDLTQGVRLSLSYDYYDRMPSLAALPDDDDPGMPPGDFDRFAPVSGSGIGPRLDLKLGNAWRVFGRYRYRETDDFEDRTHHQYFSGFAYIDPGETGLVIDGSVFVSRGGTRDYETGFLRITRDFGPTLDLSLNLAADRFTRPETVASARHVDSTWRAGISGFYRIRQDMTAIFEYERSFADDDRNSDHRVMFNWQYRF